MNCHHFRATQKSIPDAQELIWLGGGVKRPPPCSLRVNKKSGNLDQFSLYSCLFPFQFLGLALQQSKSSFGFSLSDSPNQNCS